MEENNHKSLVQQLKEFRIARGISQSEMDQAAELPKATTCKLEIEKRELAADEFLRMANVVGVPLSVFVNQGIVYSEEVKIVEALRAISFEDYQDLLKQLDSSLYYASKHAPVEQKDKLQNLSETINHLRLSDSRPRMDLANVKRVRK